MRAILWLVLLGLTSVILLLPVNLRLSPLVVWSSDVFPNLWLLGTVLLLWTTILVVLLFTSGSEATGVWDGLACSTIAGLVFRGFWTIIAPIQGEAQVHIADTRMWTILGHVVSSAASGYTAQYFDWPGASLTQSVVSLGSGMEIFPSIAALGIWAAMVAGVIVYAFLLIMLDRALYAGLGTLLILAGSLALPTSFPGRPMAIIFVVLFLLVLFDKHGAGRSNTLVVAILLLVAATVTHLHSAIHFFFFLLGLWGFNRLRGRRSVPSHSIIALVLFLILPVAWLIHWGASGLSTVTWWSEALLTNHRSLIEMLSGIPTLGQANFGESVPTWLRLTRLVWFLILYVIGGALWLRRLRRFQELDSKEGELGGALCGLLLLGILGGLLDVAGVAHAILRELAFVPLFSVTFLFLYAQQLRTKEAKSLLLSLATLLIVLSLPTFLSINRSVNINSKHPPEFAVAKWLQSLYGTGRGLRLYVPISSAKLTQYYLLDAAYAAPRTPDTTGYVQERRWEILDEWFGAYAAASPSGTPTFFLNSPTLVLDERMNLGIAADDLRWRKMMDRVELASSRIYDNGPIQVFGTRKID